MPRLTLFIALFIIAAAVSWTIGDRLPRPFRHPAPAAVATPLPNDTPPPAEGVVAEAVDPLTIRLVSGQLVRYLGVRTPAITAPVECFGPLAMQANEKMKGQRLRFESDPLQGRAADGAWLRYVWLQENDVTPSNPPSLEGENKQLLPSSEGRAGGVNAQPEKPPEIFINERILEGGFGFPHVVKDMKYGERLLAAARYASSTRRGLWGQCHPAKDAAGQFHTEPLTDCAIKGKIIGGVLPLPEGESPAKPGVGVGERIYRTPQCRAYAETIVRESAGDQWFCHEDAAAEAGFTKAADCP